MRYVVTGGAGFIGSHLVELLVAEDEDVVVVDDFSTGHRENLDRVTDRIELIEGSITDPEVCERALDGCDYLLHQAALASVPRSIADPLATHHACATGTVTLLHHAQRAGARRVVYAASSSAYGDTAELPKHEAMVPRPRSPYAAAKLAGEAYCAAFTASYGLETIALRYFNIFGPRQDPESPYAAAVPKFVTAALSEERPEIHGDGDQTRDFTYVANAVEANLLACRAPEAAVGGVYNVGCGERVSVNELWRRIRAIAGASVDAHHTEPRAGDVRHSLASLDETRRMLGYRPTVSLDDGLAATVASFREAIVA